MLLASCLGAVFFVPRPGWALDKQGSAHGGQIAGEERGVGLSGSVLLGAAVYNPSYAARPDNTGRSLFRVAPHFDLDLIGERLSIPLDVNLFTDRRQNGLGQLRPSELDLIGGLTTTWPLGPALALEFGVRGERDMPVDRGGLIQEYADTRTRLLFSLARWWPSLGRALKGGDVTGTVTFGWFTLNSSYAARPDNSGIALFRYGAYGELSAWHKHVAAALSVTTFTDRRSAWLIPSELDLVPELIGRLGAFELHVSFERDMPIDRRGFVQELVMLHAQWSFAVHADREADQEHERLRRQGERERGGGSQ